MSMSLTAAAINRAVAYPDEIYKIIEKLHKSNEFDTLFIASIVSSLTGVNVSESFVYNYVIHLK